MDCEQKSEELAEAVNQLSLLTRSASASRALLSAPEGRHLPQPFGKCQRLVAEEAKAPASSGLIATKCHDGRFLMSILLDLALAISSFCLPLCFAFGVPLATLPLLRVSLPGVDLFDTLFDRRLGSLHRLWRRQWRFWCGGNLLRWLRRLRCLRGGRQDDSGWRWRFRRNAILIASRSVQG